ncbi:bifunctional 23S rRNA (guanine(2069)-N(7))-methyltransferase RlmK/23S rRNA (guanine(2445)-N(2))-methyltransferase RlmL [Agitococcus lubricus]|uniref:Ribosomal RNA large subunit methyltransferase K/L n=1 Tax=Agitococcus lubricus TaxID=1077255 RepID=A0A2T5IVR9_9GAMM|nr:bifunctional 23S rRNA (guanine(2069)-N(7))-methyltransferase RlmK/23S rRNA (guanine(2445)-N(2))-methyltransferase RlmL [Agitococcus lubricus]PTQ87954.1 23S rRNA (guanine2445-N2)-methyltransferase / 23S rRNA (guanine2069-N7)-methyltransferase [Agitococcus lubricus]
MSLSTWVVACADGLESLLAQEVSTIGATVVKQEPSAVWVDADLKTAYRLCLWSRLASRVYKPLFKIQSDTPEDLYHEAKQYPWQDIFSLDKTFAVRAVATKGVVAHTQYMALKLKDAIVDHFRQQTGQRPSVDTQASDINIHVLIQPSSITVSLDMSGESLHRRGYRRMIGDAPLKETLAAAILMQAGWPHQKFEALVDPMCGSGTFLTEAALMFGDVAPGLMRDYFGFLAWEGHQQSVWQTCWQEAKERQRVALDKTWPHLYGYDADPEALKAATKNIQAAGLSRFIQLGVRELAFLEPKPVAMGLLVTNPPYGERLGEDDTAIYLYKALGRLAKERFGHWQAAVLAAKIEHVDALGFEHLHTQKLRNGDLNIFVRHGQIQSVPRPTPYHFREVENSQIPPEADGFANRLRKNIQHTLKQAEREHVVCYRVYDADLPEFNIAIDIYGDCLHVQEYAPPKTIDPEKAATRFKLALQVIRQVFGLHRDKVFIKVRAPQKGQQQYEKQNQRNKLNEVQEGDARLLLNLTDYLDTGLFLDHRPIRLKMAQQVAGKRFLNLFAYTCTASVHAALGGAEETVSVDLSNTYLNWGKRNFALNGIAEHYHRFIAADVMTWLNDCRERFDVIFIDPPTFSNSKKMHDVFDIQRDHVELLTLAMRLLNTDGICYFSTNFRRFELDEVAMQYLVFKEISPETIGFDFKRNAKIHRCWQVSLRP